MENIRIDYYTGTGGSELVAGLLADKLKNKNLNIEVNRIYRANINKVEKIAIDYYILIFPVHSFNAPKPIYEWVEHLAGNHCKTAVISVSGGGNVITNSACRCKTVKRLKKSNFNVIYEEMVRMPNNWVKAPKEKKYTRILSKLPNKIDEIVQTVISEKRKKKIIYWIDYLISALGEAEKKGTHKFGKGIKVLETCTGCGLCAKNCCSSNISMESQALSDTPAEPKFDDRCDMCFGCIYNCPQKALQPTYGAFQIDKNGYDLQLMCQNSILSQEELKSKTAN
jgi:ferredoxin